MGYVLIADSPPAARRVSTRKYILFPPPVLALLIIPLTPTTTSFQYPCYCVSLHIRLLYEEGTNPTRTTWLYNSLCSSHLTNISSLCVGYPSASLPIGGCSSWSEKLTYRRIVSQCSVSIKRAIQYLQHLFSSRVRNNLHRLRVTTHQRASAHALAAACLQFAGGLQLAGRWFQPHAPSASFRQCISIEIPESFAWRSCTLGGEKKRENRDISLYMLTSRPPNYRSRLSASTLGTIKTAKLPSRLCYIRSKVRGWCVSIILNVRSLLIPPPF